MHRRQFLRALGGGAGGTAGLVPMGGNVAAGGVGSGYAYEEPDLVEADADYTAATADQLDAALDARTPENPVTVWVPPTLRSTTPGDIGDETPSSRSTHNKFL